MATTTTSKAFITKDAIITICQGALGSMTFGAYHQFTTNKIMELNNEKVKQETEIKMNFIKQDNETKMNALNIKHTNEMKELKLMMDKIIEIQNKRWF